MFRVFTCLATEHDWRLVVAAGLIFFFASIVAIHFLHPAHAGLGSSRVNWIITAGVATGFGIWATHFVAMLAYRPGVPIGFDLLLTGLSLLTAVAITSLGFGLAVTRMWWAAPAGGAVVGAGTAAMHYLGMQALEIQGRVG